MRTTLVHFLTFRAQNVSPEVYWALAVIYALMVVATVASILSEKNGAIRKFLWLLVILLLPLAGMLLYTMRCMVIADFGFLKQLGFNIAARRG